MARVCFRKGKPGVQGKSGMQKCGFPDWRGVSANKSLAKAGVAAQWHACARAWALSLALQKKPGKSSSFTKVLRFQGILSWELRRKAQLEKFRMGGDLENIRA